MPNKEKWRMSFLYRKADLGPVGEAPEGVKVVDTEAVMVLSLGVRGILSDSKIDAAEKVLDQWLSENPEWVATGNRWLGYNGPSFRPQDNWSEVQRKLERVTPKKKARVASF